MNPIEEDIDVNVKEIMNMVKKRLANRKQQKEYEHPHSLHKSNILRFLRLTLLKLKVTKLQYKVRFVMIPVMKKEVDVKAKTAEFLHGILNDVRTSGMRAKSKIKYAR